MLHRSGGIIEPNRLWKDIPGIALCALVASAATWMALLAGSAVIWGLILGLVLAAIWSPSAMFQTGISFAARQVMRIGVALLGFQISLATLQILDVTDLAALAVNVAIVLAAGWFLGPMLGITRELSLVTAASVAICGASAAAAVACVVMRNDSTNRDVACTIGAVSVISSVAVILYPLMVHMAGLGSTAGGIFLGGSIHEVAHAVAAGYSVNPETGDMATVAKLFRVALLAPTCIAVPFATMGRGRSQNPSLPLPPVFLIGFVVAAMLNASGLVPRELSQVTTPLSRFCLVTSMAAIGLTLPWRSFRAFGARPIVLLLILSVILIGLSLTYVKCHSS
ncbi:YeiH family protein [Bradyrhizobium archetypum]|uniref:Putative sulfate exporter family transporter n=1 Tax=Bradyrhizobium archetypum TaxID=2721160 RepID=A0A7Y4M0S0_9BRAD|nr:putative sulfate exporter family transporter [Bradyrhizobium archetypum]NOJ45943.1 putative sulfate exporter family transporter [Bradyrhizobium archetypum]